MAIDVKELPIPSHFDSDRVGQIWPVPYQRLAGEAEAWAAEHRLRPASEDDPRIALMLVDCQNTFCIPDFELFVAGRSGTGAVDDNVRLCRFIYRYMGAITQIAATMDTHTVMQIFHPFFWVNEDGEHPTGGETILSPEEIEEGTWRVNPAVAASIAEGDYEYLQRHALHYARRLSEKAKYPLLIWPYHSMRSGIGHAMVAAVDAALFFHTIARGSQARFEIKGANPLTEHYSALGPEVMQDPDGEPLGEKNTDLIESLLSFDAVIVGGQAKSHCVAWTMRDVLTELQERDPKLARRFYLLEDCSSPVVVPGADFTDQADEAFAELAEAGMRVVRSTDPIEEWLDI